jgi:hypothetical protein
MVTGHIYQHMLVIVVMLSNGLDLKGARKKKYIYIYICIYFVYAWVNHKKCNTSTEVNRVVNN